METCNKHPDVQLKISGKRQRAKCSKCNKEYQAKWWAANKDTQTDRVKKNLQRSKEECRKYIFNYLNEHFCVHCNEKDPDVLEFDHIDPKTKRGGVCQLLLKGCTLPVIKKEIDKCQVLCANCHRKKTKQQFGWFSYNGP